jgi:hypothetical protein
MTKFLHWRKTTWIVLLWCAAMTVWPLVGNIGPVLAAVLWLVGVICLALFWLNTQPLIRQGRGLRALLSGPPGGSGA